MDVLDDLLAGTRARDGVFNLTIMDPPWAVEIRDEAPLALATLVRGSGWVSRDGITPVRMAEGDVAIFTGPSPRTCAGPLMRVWSPMVVSALRFEPGASFTPAPSVAGVGLAPAMRYETRRRYIANRRRTLTGGS